MDEMQPYEIDSILNDRSYKNRDLWEQTRMIMYIIAQVNSKRKLSPSDIIAFPWDNTKDEEIGTSDTSEKNPVTDNDVERLLSKAKSYINTKICQQT